MDLVQFWIGPIEATYLSEFDDRQPLQMLRSDFERPAAEPGPLDRVTLLALLRGLVQPQNLEFVEDSSFHRVGPPPQQEPRAARPVSDSGPMQLLPGDERSAVQCTGDFDARGGYAGAREERTNDCNQRTPGSAKGRDAGRRANSIRAAADRSLFGHAERKTTRTELYLFLTLRILKTGVDPDSVTAPRLPKVEQE